MVKKTYAKGGQTCRVTFEMPAEVGASQVVLVGEFNDWTETPLAARKDGRFSVTLSLGAHRDYRFRYLVDGCRWENDWGADAYVANEFGTEDSLIAC
jgi:1,4-alpha-glucan branching enzyme